MNLADAIGSDGAGFQTAIIDPLLNSYVRFCFELEVTFLASLLYSPWRARSMSIGCVSCLRLSCCSSNSWSARGQPTRPVGFPGGMPEPCAPLRELQGEIGQVGAVT